MIRRRLTPRPKALWTELPGQQHKLSSATEKRPSFIKNCSKRLSSSRRQYSKARERFLAVERPCAVHLSRLMINGWFWLCGTSIPFELLCLSLVTAPVATEIHHQRGRVGRLLNDERHWLAVSAEGHDWIHHNVKQARALGLLCEHGKWNTYED